MPHNNAPAKKTFEKALVIDFAQASYEKRKRIQFYDKDEMQARDTGSLR
jgi:hypothetical protein